MNLKKSRQSRALRRAQIRAHLMKHHCIMCLREPAMTTLVQVLSCMMSWRVLIRTPLVLLIRALSPLCMRSWRALIQHHKMSSFNCEVVYFAIVYLGRHAIFWGGWVRGWKSSRLDIINKSSRLIFPSFL